MAWVVQTPGGAAELVSPTLGNLLSSKVRTVVEHVTWSSTGYLFSQAHSATASREFGFFIQSGSYRLIVGGTSNILASVSSFPLVDATIDLTVDYVAGTAILICDQTEMFNGPVTISAGRSDGENFRMFGRRGGWRAPNGTRVGNTKVYLDDILVRDYDFNNSNHGAQQVGVDELITPSNNLLATNMPLDGTPWIDIGGGPVADPIRTGVISSTLTGFSQGLLGAISSNSINSIISSALTGFNQNLLGNISSNSINAIVTSTLSSFNQGLLGNVTTSVDSNITSLLNGFNQGLVGAVLLPNQSTGIITSILTGFNQGLTGGLSSTAVSGVISSTLSGFSQGLSATSLVVSISGGISSQLLGFSQGLVATATYQQHTAVIGSVLTGFRQYSVATRTEALTFRKAILNASGLPQGATLREHLKNLCNTIEVVLSSPFPVDSLLVNVTQEAISLNAIEDLINVSVSEDRLTGNMSVDSLTASATEIGTLTGYLTEDVLQGKIELEPLEANTEANNIEVNLS